MRAALESAHRGWGQSVVIGVAGAGQEIRPAFPACHGPPLAWFGIRWRQGTQPVTGMVEDAMNGKIELAPFVTHTMPLERINEAFDLMHEGKSIRTVIHY